MWLVQDHYGVTVLFLSCNQKVNSALECHHTFGLLNWELWGLLREKTPKSSQYYLNLLQGVVRFVGFFFSRCTPQQCIMSFSADYDSPAFSLWNVEVWRVAFGRGGPTEIYAGASRCCVSGPSPLPFAIILGSRNSTLLLLRIASKARGSSTNTAPWSTCRTYCFAPLPRTSFSARS